MLFTGRPLQQISEADLTDLIGTTREDDSVDFKGAAYPQPPENQLPSDQKERDRIKNEWKTDLCTDLSAFANASGGWIICGMKEQGGLATELCGLGSQINAEREIARLEQAANSGIEPPISGLAIQAVTLMDEAKSKAILIRVPRSFRAPHRVKTTRKFHVRRSGRNDEMNIDELRASFNLSQTYVNRLKEFRKQRIESLSTKDNEEIPILLQDGIRLVLHVVPLLFSEPSCSVDLSVFRTNPKPNWVLQTYFNYGRYNLEGFVRPAGREAPLTRMDGYIQVFRNGAIECVELFHTWKPKETHLIVLPNVEDTVLNLLSTALTVQKNLAVGTPLVLMLSMIGVKDCVLVSGDDFDFVRLDTPPLPLIRNTLLIPDTVIEDYSADFTELLKPTFNMLWNAAGWDKSKSYDKDGNWIGRR